MSAHFAVIMAGGSGTRLWPLSRRRRPKQLLALVDGRSLLRHALDRIAPLFTPENTFIVAGEEHRDLITAEASELPAANFIGEPVGRNTANAIGLAAHVLYRRDPDAVMAVFSADHVIEPMDVFQTAIRVGMKAAVRDETPLVTFGIRPTAPHTGYGYLRCGDAIGGGAFRVRAFVEKPNLETAERYLAKGEYLWNAGIFCWRISAILNELRRYAPENCAALETITKNWGDPAASAEIRAQFAQLKSVSIDYAVMEHAKSVAVVPMECQWRDIGSWSALSADCAADDAGNMRIGANIVGMESHNNLIVSDGASERLVLLIGVNDLVVVDTPDATLICRRDLEQRVRDGLKLVQERVGDEYD
ncbi:MAG: mannose-1-phosphate guanylyltransferase [Phycisphaerales bacterium]|nr:mannose-1-phosphate guanylyltransferase [Phycisphaerales bacterium]